MSRKSSTRQRRRAAAPPPLDCYSILQFCERHGISRPHFYRLREKGLTPVEFRLGTRVLITREAADAWRAERSRPSKRNPAAAIPTAI
jgi:predicted DNA-binding transcriptional regulator AlpA